MLAARRELGGIAQQIEDDLPQHLFIDEHQRQFAVEPLTVSQAP